MKHAMKRHALIEEGGDIIANIEHEPDGDKGGDTVQVSLQKITDDVAIEQFHLISKFDLRSMLRVPQTSSFPHTEIATRQSQFHDRTQRFSRQ